MIILDGVICGKDDGLVMFYDIWGEKLLEIFYLYKVVV